MQKNWYAVYTKPQCEKKVAALLSKKKIENFCPLGSFETQSFRRSRQVLKPLFKSYVFVHVTQADFNMLKKTDWVVSMLYWLGQPAVIKDEEIAAIKEFTADHKNIELERGNVNVNDTARNFSASSYAIDGNLVTIKNKVIKINLPSLGYTMKAKIEDESIFGRESMLQSTTFVHSS